MQKQPTQMFCRKKCFQKFRKFHWKTTVMESLFNKGAKAYNFIKERLQHRYFPVKFAKFLKTSILMNPSSVNGKLHFCAVLHTTSTTNTLRYQVS